MSGRTSMLESWANQRNGSRMSRLIPGIPIPSAVNRKLGDLTSRRIGTNHFPCIPVFPVLRRTLFELKDESGFRRVTAPARDFPRARMPRLTERNNLFYALGLQPPLGHSEVTEDLFFKQTARNRSRFQEVNEQAS